MVCGKLFSYQPRKKEEEVIRYTWMCNSASTQSALLRSVPCSTSCQGYDTVGVVATFINQTICHCKINLQICFLRQQTASKNQQDLITQCDKANINALGTASYLIRLSITYRVQNTKKKLLVLPPGMFAELKAFQAVAGSKIKSFSKEATFCPNIAKISDQVGSNLRS